MMMVVGELEQASLSRRQSKGHGMLSSGGGLGGGEYPRWFHSRAQAISVLKLSIMGTYTKYPYHEFRVTRALSLLLAQQQSQ
jgi:hypothetical protein